MTLQLNLKSLPARIIFLVLALALAFWLIVLVIGNFITSTLVDERIGLNDLDKNALEATLKRYPNSPRLNARVAQAEMLSFDRNPAKVLTYAQRAVNLSPFNYEYRLLLASAQELQGDRAAAELSLKKAVELAPNNPDPHWQLANVLLRQGKLGEALPEFKHSSAANPANLPATLDLLWRVSGGKVEVVDAATSDDATGRLTLTRFLMKQQRLNEAAAIFSRMDKQTLRTNPDVAAILNGFVQNKQWTFARQIWLSIVSDAPPEQAPLLWNGSFEDDSLKDFTQFDWNLARSDFARFAVDTSTAHSGSRSIRIDFIKDTTKLDGELKQALVLKPGMKYRLEFYVKSDKFSGFSTPHDLQIVLQDLTANKDVAVSEPIKAGTSDWRRLSVDFVAPESSASGLLLKLRRLPEFSYDEPARGSVWLDDFSIKAL